MNPFEERLEVLSRIQPQWHSAIMEVCDTAEMAHLWLSERLPAHTAADVVALASLIVVRARGAV
jgi:hypothetical protein